VDATIHSKSVDASKLWVKTVSDYLHRCDTSIETSLRTMVTSDMQDGQLSLFLPPEMSRLQPENLRYLHAVAARYGYTLVEDRRTGYVQPLIEQREFKPNTLASGLGQLLQQTGMPGKQPKISNPHRLILGNPHCELPTLLKMVSGTIDDAKLVIVQPNEHIQKAVSAPVPTVNAFACKALTAKAKTTISFFDARGFKAIGYVADDQFVMHAFVGGGPIKSPQLWVNPEAMRKNRFKFQLFINPQHGQDFGLFYNTFYFDLDTAAAANHYSRLAVSN